MLPNFIVIGAQKCGTTSLHYYLAQHPQIFMSGQKELDFFKDEPAPGRDIDWYQKQFSSPKACAALARGEISPSYSHCTRFPGTAARLAAALPDIKLIYLIGDPLRRIVSSYVHHYTLGAENLGFAEAMEQVLADNEGKVLSNYLIRSRYYFQLSQYLPFYPRERILLVTREELWENRAEVLRRIFQFLGVDENFTSPRFAHVKHRTMERRRKTEFGHRLAQSGLVRPLKKLPNDLYLRGERFLFYPWSYTVEKPEISEELRGRIIDALRDDVAALREYSGLRFEKWSL